MNKIIIVGGAASGKTHLKDRFINKGYKFCISYTTRKPRKNELNGRDYYFINREQFNNLILQEKLYEYVEYSGYMYGKLKDEFYSSNLFVMEPKGIKNIKEEDRKNSFIIFINIEEEIRIKRLKYRGTNIQNIKKRIKKDKDIFYNFTDYDLLINNPNF